MQTIYNKKIIFDISQIVVSIKKIISNFKIKSSNDKENSEKLIDDFVNFYESDSVFQKDLKLMKYYFDEIAELLKQLDFFNNEYYDFLSIKLMCNHILDDTRLLISYSQFVNTILGEFLNLLQNFTDYKYNSLYNDFKIFLDQCEHFFYISIYQSSHKHDDLIDGVTNILG